MIAQRKFELVMTKKFIRGVAGIGVPMYEPIESTLVVLKRLD